MTRFFHVWLTVLAASWLAVGCSRHEPAATTPPPPPAPLAATNAAPSSRQAHMAQYYSTPSRKDPTQHQVKLEFFGDIPTGLPVHGEFPFTNFKLVTYETNGDVQMILTAPECIGSTGGGAGAPSQARSAGPFHAETGDGNFILDGIGFLWTQDETNSTLVISNHVVTTIQKALLASSLTNAGAGGATAGTNQNIRIFADRFYLDRLRGTAIYSGNVRAEDEQFEVRAETMNLYRGPNGSNSLVARTHIIINDKLYGNRATGERADYTSDGQGAQRLTLTENPRWESGDHLSYGTADEFSFDHAANTFQAQGRAHFVVASTGNLDTNFFLTTQSPAPARTGSPRMVEINSDLITLDRAATNGPPAKMAADGHVVIVDEATGSRTTADHAKASPADGAFELLGNAQYQVGEELVRAEWLSVNRTAQTIFARTNTLVQFPPTALGGSGALRGIGSGRSSRATNGLVAITADAFDYQGGLLTFRDHVHTSYAEGPATLATMDCGQLTATVRSNVVTRLLAEQSVHFHQSPMTDAKGKISEGDLNTQRVEITMHTNGTIDAVNATGGVAASQKQTSPGGSIARLGLTSDTLAAKFLAGTNDIESASASGHVKLSDNELAAHGDKLEYTGSNETAVLTGKPFLERPGARSTAETAIIYDHLHNVVRVQGHPQTVATVPVNGSNVPGFISPQKSPGKTNP